MRPIRITSVDPAHRAVIGADTVGILLRDPAFIEIGSIDIEGARAVLEFPGVWNEEGKLVCHPDYRWLVDQFLKFGTIKADHCVDAITQLLPSLDLRPGSGPDASERREVVKVPVNEGLRLMNMELEAKMRMGGREAAQDELELLCGGETWN